MFRQDLCELATSKRHGGLGVAAETLIANKQLWQGAAMGDLLQARTHFSLQVWLEELPLIELYYPILHANLVKQLFGCSTERTPA